MYAVFIIWTQIYYLGLTKKRFLNLCTLCYQYDNLLLKSFDKSFSWAYKHKLRVHYISHLTNSLGPGWGFEDNRLELDNEIGVWTDITWPLKSYINFSISFMLLAVCLGFMESWSYILFTIWNRLIILIVSLV